MFGFLKRMLGGRAADGPVDNRGVLSISQDDLESPNLLGPKLAAYAQMQDHIDKAVYDAEAELIGVRYTSGIDANVFIANKIAAMRQMQTGAQVADYLRSMFADIDPQSDGRLLPVLKPASYIENARDQLRQAGLGDGEELPFWYLEVAPGLLLQLVHDAPDSMRTLSRDELKAKWLNPGEALQHARSEMVDYINERELGIASMYEDRLHQWKFDDNYEASLFFIHELWEARAEDFGAPPAAIFAARNIVVFANSADPEAMTLLRAVAAAEGEEPAYAIMPRQIWLYQDKNWTPYEGPDDKPERLN